MYIRKMKNKLLLPIIILVLFFLGCEKVDYNDLGTAHMRFFNTLVFSIGEPSDNDSKMNFYSSYRDSMWYGAYQELNDKPIGEYVKTGVKVKDEFWLLLPNSNRILVMDAVSLLFKTYIENINTPNCIEVTYKDIFVGSKDKPLMYRIDPETKTVEEKYVPYPNISSLKYFSNRNKTYIACNVPQCKEIFVYDDTIQQVNDAFEIGGYAPSEIAVGEYGEVIILSGSLIDNIAYVITRASRGSWPATDWITLPNGAEYRQMKNIQLNSSGWNDETIRFLANNPTDNIGVMYELNTRMLEFQQIVSTQNLGLEWDYISNYYQAPNNNFYLIGGRNGEEAEVNRLLDEECKEELANFNIENPNSFLLFLQ